LWASGCARYPLAIDPDRSTATKLAESINFQRLQKIRTQVISRQSTAERSRCPHTGQAHLLATEISLRDAKHLVVASAFDLVGWLSGRVPIDADARVASRCARAIPQRRNSRPSRYARIGAR
jgi:hypothetical protein